MGREHRAEGGATEFWLSLLGGLLLLGGPPAVAPASPPVGKPEHLGSKASVVGSADPAGSFLHLGVRYARAFRSLLALCSHSLALWFTAQLHHLVGCSEIAL